MDRAVGLRGRSPAALGALVLRRDLLACALDEGLICYPMGGTIDGHSGDHVLLAPPFIISQTEVEDLVTRLARAIDRALAA